MLLSLNNMDIKEIARLFSEGHFDLAAPFLTETVTWHIYEEKQALTGKKAVLDFAAQIAEYFRSVTTAFETSGCIAEGNTVAVYGKATFSRNGNTINSVNSCDVYEFDAAGNIVNIHSYCNSSRPA
ncbi:MAG: nuclear transport factor 2 family protein [Chitinophagaceae bacterium]|nr:nuclear transport factor 2 family protein [Chitinophagaceae bacterium]